MCLQDVAIAIRYRTVLYRSAAPIPAVGLIPGGPDLWSITLLPSATDQVVIITFLCNGLAATVRLSPPAGSGLPFTITRAEVGDLFDKGFSITGTDGELLLVAVNYLDKDVYQQALELEF